MLLREFLLSVSFFFGLPGHFSASFHQHRYDSSTLRKKFKNNRGVVGISQHGSSESTEKSLPILRIDGILPPTQFKSRSALHETLNELRQQIPRLLSVPLSEASAEKVYTKMTRLTVGTENSPVELSSDRSELISLCNTFVLVLAASIQARNILSDLVQGRRQRFDPQDEPSVECQIALLIPDGPVHMNQDFDTIVVRWHAFIPTQQPIVAASTKIKGVSRLTLDPDSSKIASHQLLCVFINDSLFDSNAVGQSLSSLRQAVKGMQDSPFLQPIMSSTTSSPVALSALEVFQQVRDDFINRQLKQKVASPELPPLFVILDYNTSNSSFSTNSTSWVPIDSYSSKQSEVNPFPLPGTTAWPVYASCHRLAEYFLGTIIPMLSGRDGETLDDTLFDPSSCLYASDGSILLNTGTLLAGYYRSLATLLLGTRSKWSLKSVRVLSWGTKVGTDATKAIADIQVEFSTEVRVPGSSSVAISGIDVYTVSSLVNCDVENLRGCFNCEEVHQKQLLIGDNSKSFETLLLMRSVASALESSSGLMPVSDGFWFDFLRRFSLNDSKRQTERSTDRLPIRSDKAAKVVYRIMEALHQDYIFTSLTSDFDIDSALPPGNAFMPENVQLIGYLGEPLLRGRTSYNQAYQVVVRSFHAALKSKSLLSLKEPAVQVELNASGNIVWSLSLFLKVSTPLAPALPGLDNASSAFSNGNVLSSFNIVVKSEYSLCPDSGQILQHRLLESRINGHLTPGDVVSRWVKHRNSDASGQADPVDWLRKSLESVEWLRLRSG